MINKFVYFKQHRKFLQKKQDIRVYNFFFGNIKKLQKR